MIKIKNISNTSIHKYFRIIGEFPIFDHEEDLFNIYKNRIFNTLEYLGKYGIWNILFKANQMICESGVTQC